MPHPTPDIVARAMAGRFARGLCLTWHVPGRPDPFRAFPRDQQSAAAWRQQAAANGWTEIHPNQEPDT